MRIIIVTQKVDAADSNLGFFVRWIEKLAERAEVAVIANAVGEHPLSPRTPVYSLGKERGAGFLARFARYERLLLSLLPSADGIFFHMCPEYVLGAHLLPMIFRVKTLLWYVHRETNWRLRLAEKLVRGIFTASAESCRLRSKKVVVAGHGIDTELFSCRRGKAFSGLHLLTAGRVAPAKDLETLILGFFMLQERFPDATFSVAGGTAAPCDEPYAERIARLVSEHHAAHSIQFLGGMPHGGMPRQYCLHNVFMHASKTGSADKAVLEALACGLSVVTSSEAFSEEIPGVFRVAPGSPRGFAEQAEALAAKGKIAYNAKGREWVAANHGLEALARKIIAWYAPSSAGSSRPGDIVKR